MTLGDTETTTRQRRQLAETAISQATNGEWEAAVETNRQLLELGPDTDGYNRLGKALAELGRHAEALEAYEQALARDATNRIAERNVARLRVLLGGGDGTTANGNGKPEKASAADFIEEMGKTGHARVINLGPARQLAPLSPGDAVDLVLDGDVLVARVGEVQVGQVEPRVGARLGKLMKGGNRYEAAITVVSADEVRIIIRETFAHPDNFGKVSFPGSSAARPTSVRPDIRGSALRYDDEGEESEELEEEPEEVEELDTSLPEFSAEPELEEELLEEP
ncbi:MAG TPA: tetratricopeptide repeat protein [Candidatus Limnocylindria bacterium]|jgi:tetratricopeptide (TPR) repeat protein|nr:tetratricopeptide repeat protein [Candidatus Limnocylindria bacterium]